MTRQRRLHILVDDYAFHRRAGNADALEKVTRKLAEYVFLNIDKIMIASDPEKPEPANG